ncbi:hypothetical protein [Daejeonia sp. YH14]|uniref:hypothetical protein n=1 Tax=Daejeonia sp. YH14 TaxID=3439042 RepID=UPI003F492FFC
MKKTIISSVLTLFTLTSISANNNIEKNKNHRPSNLCTVAVTYYNSAGQVTGYGAFSSQQPTLSACQDYQQSVINDLRRQGYIVTGGPQKPTTSVEP